MLAISRRPGQAIFVYPADNIDPNMTVAELFSGGPIKIMTDIKNGQVKVGIAAPRHLTVLREELVRDKPLVEATDGEPVRKRSGRAEAATQLEAGARYGRQKTLIR